MPIEIALASKTLNKESNEARIIEQKIQKLLDRYQIQ